MLVHIESRSPVHMSVDAADFGKLFSQMNSLEQVAVLQEVVDAMKTQPMQWDYIAIELEKPEHAELRRDLVDIIRSMKGEGF